MRTIREVAQRAGVSVGTVSNVLSGSVPVSERLKQRVLQVIQELDYQPNQLARSLKVKQTKMIGMVIRNVADPVFPQMLRGAEDAARHRDYLLVLLTSDEQADREHQILKALRTRRVDGILLVSDPRAELSHIRAVRDAGTPIVSLEREIPDVGLDCVVADHFNGARECVHHLIRQGYREIGWIHGRSEDFAVRDRFAGYRKGLEEAGVEFDAALVAGAETAGGLLRRNPQPPAVLVTDALLAASLLFETRIRGEMTLATFDHPRISEALRMLSVTQPAYEMGFQAMELLIRRIHDPSLPHSKVTLPCSLQLPRPTEAAVSAEQAVK